MFQVRACASSKKFRSSTSITDQQGNIKMDQKPGVYVLGTNGLHRNVPDILVIATQALTVGGLKHQWPIVQPVSVGVGS